MSEYIRADAWIGLCELIDEFGGNPADVLAASGLAPEDLLPVDRYHPIRKFIATLNHAVSSTGRKDFGLQLGLRRELDAIGVVGLALGNGRTWREIVAIAARIGHIANPLVTYEVIPAAEHGAEMIWIDDREATVPDREQGIERTATFILRSAWSLVRDDFVPIAVHFQHDQIAPIESYVAALGLKPAFNQPRSGMTVASEDLDRPIPSADPEMGSLAIRYLERNKLIEEGDLVRAARLTARALVELREASAETLASTLGLEVRTLQRRLKSEGASIEAVFDEARRSLVERLLTDNLHSLSEVTHLLGYTTSATLTRNCKRWFGDTPAKLRLQLRSQ